MSNFLLHGVAGLDSVRPPGRPAKLGAEQLSQLSEYIDQQSRLAIGGRLQGTDIQTYIRREFGVAYELSNVYRLLRAGVFLDNQSLTTSETGWAGAGSF